VLVPSRSSFALPPWPPAIPTIMVRAGSLPQPAAARRGRVQNRADENEAYEGWGDLQQGVAMQLCVLGCGDAFGSGGRFNTCFHFEAPATRFLIDCGASALIAMRRFEVDPNGIETVFLTHLHGDHCGGLPLLILDAQLISRRATPLTIAGPPGLRERLGALTEAMFPGSSNVERKFALEFPEPSHLGPVLFARHQSFF